MIICCSFNCLHHRSAPLDHFVHMVLFLHCADDDDKPVLHQRERARLDPRAARKATPSFISGDGERHEPKEELFKDTPMHRHDSTSTLIQPHQLNRLVAKDKSNDAEALRSRTPSTSQRTNKAGRHPWNLSLVVLYVLSGDT